MITDKQVCSICRFEPSTLACVCDNEVKLIGVACLPDHLRNFSTSHELVELELAYRIQSNLSLIDDYMKAIINVSNISSYLKLRSNKLTSCQKYLNDQRTAFHTEIDRSFNRVINSLGDLGLDAEMKLRRLYEFKRNMCDEGKELIESFRHDEEDLAFKKRIESLDVSYTEAEKILNESLSISQIGGRFDIQINDYKKKEEEEKDESIKIMHQILEERDKVIESLRKQVQAHQGELDSKDTLIRELSLKHQDEVGDLKRRISYLQEQIKMIEIKEVNASNCKSVQRYKIKMPLVSKIALPDMNLCHSGIELLFASQFPKLIHLDIFGNRILAKGIEIIASAKFPFLKHLNLGLNGLEFEGTKHIKDIYMPNLLELNLEGNDIGDQGLHILLEGSYNKLEYLNLRSNFLNVSSVYELLNSNLKRIKHLNLEWNYIDDEYTDHEESLRDNLKI